MIIFSHVIRYVERSGYGWTYKHDCKELEVNALIVSEKAVTLPLHHGI